ncbi:metalloregulator ArsR/SmtB family transcription factor [Serratia sp. TSA_198.1]|jgi:ArsR family transcriptional regulator|uniref:metalloregulator ArsR/SmtB family transcription factor n=1 Tax=Serratia sp. TSA_198.1 TaxID=3415664 RepID=UPI0040460A49
MPSLTPLKLFKNLSDDTRLNLVLLLRQAGELCVCELSGALDESQPKISRHLAMLRESGLLLDRREGKWIFYRLSPHMPAWAAAIIEQAWLSQQQGFAELAQQAASGGRALCR